MENIIERTIALTESPIIRCEDLPSDIGKITTETAMTNTRLSSKGIDMNRVISEIEREMIQQALELGKGVKARAADLLKINRTTLVEKIKRLGIENRR